MVKRFLGSALQIALVLTLILIAVVIAFLPDDTEEADSSTLEGISRARSPTITVAVIEPAVISAPVEVEATGSIGYRTSVGIVSQVSGRVIWVSKELRTGGRFNADQILFKLDPKDAELGVEQAKADLAVALSDKRLTEAESAAAIDNYKLLNPKKDVPSLVAREPQLERSEAAISRAKARLRVAELALSRTEFSLPFNGRVLDTTVDVGQLVGVNQVLGQVFSEESLEAAIPLSSSEVAVLEPLTDRLVKIFIEGSTLDAKVERLSANLDTRTRTATAYANIVSEKHDLVPGKFFSAVVIGDQVHPAYLLPNEVEQAKNTVWLVEEGKLLRQAISIKDRRADGILVDAFPYFDGIVLGAMPDQQEGTEVQVSKTDNS